MGRSGLSGRAVPFLFKAAHNVHETAEESLHEAHGFLKFFVTRKARGRWRVAFQNGNARLKRSFSWVLAKRCAARPTRR